MPESLIAGLLIRHQLIHIGHRIRLTIRNSSSSLVEPTLSLTRGFHCLCNFQPIIAFNLICHASIINKKTLTELEQKERKESGRSKSSPARQEPTV